MDRIISNYYIKGKRRWKSKKNSNQT